MSQQSLLGHRRLRVSVPLTARDLGERNRAATPLELFFDLVFVVAVALAADNLAAGIVAGEAGDAVLSFVLVFFTIYWAWVNFTWFASAYDNDDLIFRLFVFITIIGALVFAAGVPRTFHGRDFTIAVSGYAVMRAALVWQWLRVGRDDTARRTTAHRFAVSLTLLQMGWLAALALPEAWYMAAWVALALGEVLVPIWAESASRTMWHAEHIAERYGLFMIIVLGESVLAASRALQIALDGGGLDLTVLAVLVGGLLLVFSIWWTYFDRPDDHLLRSLRGAFTWSYLHLLVFMSVAGVGAGLVVAIEASSGEGDVSPPVPGLAVAVPFSLYVLSLWSMYVRSDDGAVRKFAVPAMAALVLGSAFMPLPVLLMGLFAGALVMIKIITRLRSESALVGDDAQV